MFFSIFLGIKALYLHFFMVWGYPCHPERSEGYRVHKVGVYEILPSCGRLNDKYYCIFASVFARN